MALPFRYRLYNTVCYLAISLAIILLTDLVFEMSRPGIRMVIPVFSIVVLLLFFTSYFAHPILGCKLVRSLKSNYDVSQTDIIFTRIIFFVQIIFQIFIAYHSASTVTKALYMVQNHSGLYSFYEGGVLMELMAAVLCALTFYLEIFTFPLISAVRKNYRAALEQINTIGSTE